MRSSTYFAQPCPACRPLPAVAIAAVALAPAAAHRPERAATPATFGSVFASAQAGDTVLLAAGDYGSFQGAMKAGEVTVKAQPGATASMRVNFRPASNITLDGLTIGGLTIGDSRTKNITVRNSLFDRSQATLRTGELVTRTSVDRNRHIGFVAGGGGGEGRIFLPERTGQPAGVTIRDSLFEGGNSDGVQNGGRGVRILDNEFRNMHQIDGADGVHADSIQLYGSAETVIRGNYFHHVAVGIMCADGCDHEVIEDNVLRPTARRMPCSCCPTTDRCSATTRCSITARATTTSRAGCCTSATRARIRPVAALS